MKRISTTELNNAPTSYIHKCHKEPIEITRYGKTVAYLVSPQVMNVSTNFTLGSFEAKGGEDEKTHDHS